MEQRFGRSIRRIGMGMIVTIGFLCSLLVIAPVIALLLSTDKAGKQYATC
jgi:hypothetical protein